MKNVLGTFAMLAVLGIIGYFGWNFYQSVKPTPKPLTGEGILAVEKQEIIWDAEHVTFEVEHRLGKAFLKAWQEQDVDKLKSLLHSDFQATLPQTDEWTVINKPPLEEKIRITLTGEEKLPTSNDTTAFLTAIIDPIRDVKIKKKKLRVLKIADMGNDLWRCRFLLAGSGVDKDSIQRHVQSEHEVLLTIPDEKQLGKAASIKKWDFWSETVRRCDKPIMEEITDELELDKSGLADNWNMEVDKTSQHNFQIAVEDFDLDGDLDISVMSVSSARAVFAFEDGKYKNVTKDLEIPEVDADPRAMDIFSTAWIDIDNDGYPELISGARIFKNHDGKKFSLLPSTNLGFDAEVMGLNVVDYNNDGWLDLYVIYQRPFGLAANTEEGQEAVNRKSKWIDEEASGKENQLFRNNGDGTFGYQTTMMGVGGGKRHSQSAVWFHYDDDIYPDLYVANDFARNLLLRNGGPNNPFEDISQASGSDGFATSMGVVAGDVDNDGKSDIYVSNMFSKMGRRIIEMVSEEDYTSSVYSQIVGSCSGNRLYRRSGPDGRYEDTSIDAGVNEVGWAWGPTMADLDSDGWLDLYSTTGFMSFDRKKPDG